MNTMNTKPGSVQSGRVTTEGDDLYYEVRGQGPPLLMISAGGGDGDYYAAIADRLCDEYKVITYDRRANARSTMNDPQNFEISQQSRDGASAGQEMATFLCPRLCDGLPLWPVSGRAPVYAWRSNPHVKTGQGSNQG